MCDAAVASSDVVSVTQAMPFNVKRALLTLSLSVSIQYTLSMTHTLFHAMRINVIRIHTKSIMCFCFSFIVYTDAVSVKQQISFNVKRASLTLSLFVNYLKILVL